MNYDAITIQDCLDMYELLDQVTVIENGRVIRFEREVNHVKSNIVRIR